MPPKIRNSKIMRGKITPTHQRSPIAIFAQESSHTHSRLDSRMPWNDHVGRVAILARKTENRVLWSHIKTRLVLHMKYLLKLGNDGWHDSSLHS